MLKKSFCLFCVLSLTLLCGCNGYRETNDGLFVTAICFEGAAEGYNAAIEILYSPENESGTEREVLYSSGATPALCIAVFKSSLSRELYFEHCGAVIVNESLSDERIQEVIDYCKAEGVNLSCYLATTPDPEQLFETTGFSGNTGFEIMLLMKKVRSEEEADFSNRIYETEHTQSLKGKSIIPRLCVKQGKISVSGEQYVRKGNEYNEK